MSFFNMFGPESPTEEHQTSNRSIQENNSMLSNEADEAGERQMTQDEVNRLVHDALRRARKATSPRKRSTQASATTSPHSIDSSNHSSRMSPQTPDVILSPPPKRVSSSKNRNNNNNASFSSDPSQSHMDELLSTTVDSQTSTYSKHNSSSRTRGGITKHLHNIVGTVSSDPSQTEMDTLLSPTMDSIETGSYVSSIVNTDSIRSVNSSDSVLRKVEEEIQNARRAAQEHRKTHKEEAPEILLSPTQELSGILDDHLADDADLHDILDTSDDFIGQYFERAKPGASMDNWDGAEQLRLDFRPEPEVENEEAGGVFDDDSEFGGEVDESQFDGEVVVDDSQFIAEEDAEVAIITSRSSQGISPNKKPSVTPQTSDESPSDRPRPEEETPGSENAVFMGASPDPAQDMIESPLFDEQMDKGIAYSAVDGMEAVEVGVEIDYMAPASTGSRAIDDTAEEKKFDNPAVEEVNGKLKKRDDFIGVVDEPDLIEKLSKSMSVGSPRAAPSKNPSEKTAKAPTDGKEVRKNGQHSGSPDFQDHIERYASATQDSDDKAETKVAGNSSEYSERTISDADIARIGSEVVLSAESECTEEEISEVDSEYTEETVEDDEMERTDSFSTANETAPSPPKSDKQSSKPQPLPTVISGEAPSMNMRASTPVADVQASRADVDISTLDTPVARTQTKERKVDVSDSSSKSAVLQQPNLIHGSKPSQKVKSPTNRPERGSPWSSTRKGNAENVPPKSPARVQKQISSPPPPPPPKQEAPATPTGSRKIHFRHPYPYPPPLAQPRSTTDIVNQNKLGVPDQFTKWFKAKPDLQQLLMAARGDSLHRRSNACGALKVLSQQKKNQLALVRTKGFLDALAFAISAPIPENHDTDIALDSRGRAVTTLHSVADPKDNRQLVMVHPGIADCLLKVIEDDEGEARVQACATLAILAKTAANREYMANVDGLLDILGQVLLGSIDDEVEPGTSMEDNGKNSDSEDSDGESEDGEASSVGVGSKSFSSVEDGHTTFDDETMSLGVSSSMSSIQPPTKNKRTKQKSIRMHKDDMHEQFLRQARVNACAALIHLSKHCAVSTILASNASVIGSLVEVSREFDNPIHTKCVEMICNLTRFPSNPARLARNDALVETLVKCGKSKILADRIWSMRSFQNITSDSSSKVILANARILTLLSICSMRKDYEEQLGAVAALYNLSTEPGAVVPLTNTRNVVATLVHLAHNAVSTPELRNMACDALATIGLWLQTLAGSGTVPPSIEKELLPSHQTTGWQRWD